MNSIYKISRGFSFTYPCPRKLREIMKFSLIQRENKDVITDIWMKYHADKTENVSYALTRNEYNKLQTRVKQSPMFLIPVKKKAKSTEHFMMIGQGQEKTFMFTYLEDFKKQQANAQPYFILTMFDELLDKRELALVRGDIINFQIDKQQAEWVQNQTLALYLKDDLYNNLVYNFNHQPQLFEYEQLQQHFQI